MISPHNTASNISVGVRPILDMRDRGGQADQLSELARRRRGQLDDAWRSRIAKEPVVVVHQGATERVVHLACGNADPPLLAPEALQATRERAR